MLCRSPHLFSVVTLPQENKVPFNNAGTHESVPLTAIMLMIKMYRLNKTIQIHNAYVSVITCVRSVRLRQIHNSEGVYATRRWPRQLRAVGLQATLQPIAASAFADCQLIVSNASRRRLRSADIDTCVVPRTNTRLGDRNFAVVGPRLWNSLPAELRQPDIELEEFRRLLKTFLFA